MMLFFVSRETMKYNKYVIEFNCIHMHIEVLRQLM